MNKTGEIPPLPRAKNLLKFRHRITASQSTIFMFNTEGQHCSSWRHEDVRRHPDRNRHHPLIHIIRQHYPSVTLFKARDVFTSRSVRDDKSTQSVPN